jgi:uncharacterized protein (TIRG00374 family)
MGEYSAALAEKHRRKAALGYAIAASCLVWVFYDVRAQGILDAVRNMQWKWVALAVAFDIGSYLCQGKRWALLLQRCGPITTLRATHAIYAALFVNEILPLRAGEAVRSWLVAKWLKASFINVFSSLLVERFLDSIWLVLAIGLTVWLVPLPRYLVDAEEILAALVLVGGTLFLYAVLRTGPVNVGAGTSAGLRRHLRNLAAGIASIGRSRLLYASFGVSAVMLVFQVVSYWLVMRAYGLGLSLWHGAAVFLILRLGTIIPTAPSNIGTYQFFTVAGLTIFGVDKTLATGFSIVVFLILTVPLWTIGIFAFTRAGLSLSGVRAGKFGAQS